MLSMSKAKLFFVLTGCAVFLGLYMTTVIVSRDLERPQEEAGIIK